MKKFTVVIGSFLLVVLLLAVSQLGLVYADGTETLGDPSIPIEAGTGIVAAGIGLQDVQPGTININVPGDVVQVLLYWSGTVTSDAPSDDTIEVDGNVITGTLIGGQAFFFDGPGGKQFYDSNYRADITNLGLVSSGANNLSVEGLDNKDGDGNGANSGAGILVIYDDGSIEADITIKDGLDLAFAPFPEPRKTTVPQTFTFVPSASERTADLIIFASSAGENRPNTIGLDSDAGDIPDVEDALASVDGDLWDTITLEVTIPANATEVTVELISGSSSAGLPASLNWIGGGLSVPPPLGCIGDYVWFDEDGDGNQNEDPNTHGLENITVRLFISTGPDTYTLVGVTTTDALGWYMFCELPEGIYLVDVHDPDIDSAFPGGWVSTTNNDPYPIPPGTPPPPPVGIDLGPGEIYLFADFGYDDLGEDQVALGDWVWYDEDGNGDQNEPEENGIPCVTIWLYEAGNPDPIGQTNTDTWGFYYFGGLPTTQLPNGYSTEVDQLDEDIDAFLAAFNGGPDPATCNQVEEIFPTFNTPKAPLMQPMAEPTTPGTATMQDSNIGGTTDLTLDYAFNDPTAISLASFEVTEAAASTPGNLALAAVVMALLGTGAWLLRRRQVVK